MSTPRFEIRQRVVELLTAEVDGERPTAAGRAVYNSRDWPVDSRRMPVAVVYTLAERLDTDFHHDGGVRRRIMEMRVEFYADGDDAAEAVDTGAHAIENVLHASPTLGNLVEWCKLTDVAIAFAKTESADLFVSVMTFEVIYYTHLVEDDGVPPTTVLLGFDPNTGLGNEEAYADLGIG